jgi:hypothetical protein
MVAYWALYSDHRSLVKGCYDVYQGFLKKDGELLILRNGTAKSAKSAKFF